eukprot:scaffold54286_cov19-Tisochrysis_lutea.AAC.1
MDILISFWRLHSHCRLPVPCAIVSLSLSGHCAPGCCHTGRAVGHTPKQDTIKSKHVLGFAASTAKPPCLIALVADEQLVFDLTLNDDHLHRGPQSLNGEDRSHPRTELISALNSKNKTAVQKLKAQDTAGYVPAYSARSGKKPSQKCCTTTASRWFASEQKGFCYISAFPTDSYERNKPIACASACLPHKSTDRSAGAANQKHQRTYPSPGKVW